MLNFYNHETKLKFLKDQHESTQLLYENIFKSSTDQESLLQRDLYDFTIEEVAELIYGLNKSTVNSVYAIVSIVRTYINWAIKLTISKSNINPIEKVDQSFYFSLIDRTKKLYITDEELEFIENEVIVNAQDKVLYRLMFEGVNGKRLSELRNLRHEDIKGNMLSLRDDEGRERELKVSDRCAAIIEEAQQQKTYEASNGMSERIKEFAVADSMYIAKKILAGRANITSLNEPIGVQSIYTRIDMIKEALDTPYLTANNIRKSGMIAKVKDIIITEGRELTTEEYTQIAKDFGYQLTEINGQTTYNYYAVKRLANKDTVKELYNISNI
jgi:hypothetical protein